MKYRMVTLFILFISIVGCNGNDRSDLPTEQILELAKEFNGDIGIYVKDLESGAEFEVNAYTLFPTASMVKIPILVKIFDKIEQGELEYQTELDYGPEPEYEYSGDIISNLIRGYRSISI